MTPEEQEKQKAKAGLEVAERNLNKYTDECTQRLTEALAHKAAEAVTIVVIEKVATEALKTNPVFRTVITGLEIAGDINVVNAAYGPCYEEEINYWKKKVKEAENKYQDKDDRAEFGKRYPIMLRDEVRKALIDKEMELKKSSGKRKDALNEYRNLYDSVFGDKVWAYDNSFTDSSINSAKAKTSQLVSAALKQKLK